MAEVYTARTTTYVPQDQVTSADLNAIQDGIIACSEAIGDVAELDSGDMVGDLTGRSRLLRIVPWAHGLQPNTPAGANEIDENGSAPVYAQAADANAKTVQYPIDALLAMMVVETLTKLRMYYGRTSASAVLTLKLIRERLSDGATTTLQTLTATDSSGTWTSQATSGFTETYDPTTYLYYLELGMDCDAAVTELKVRALELEFEGKYIGS